MPEINSPTIDTTALEAQIGALRVQRDNAMNDVTILYGQLESKNKAYDELLRRYTEIHGAAEAAEQPEAPKTEDQPNLT